MAVIALCDCDNFFVSCERISRPDLEHAPVVVLSSNDGCIISRSAEVKAMGVQMGEPYFKVKALLASRGVAVFSGDLPYYRSVSARVMAVLSRWSPSVEVYSIDEAFLDLSAARVDDVESCARGIRDAVRRLVGVPISVGVASSKTLAKLASKEAKRSGGVCVLDSDRCCEILDASDIEDVWGIGRRGAEMLRRWGVRTAGDLVRRDPVWVKRRLRTPGAITQLELNGCSCIPIETESRAPRSMQSSHVFGAPLRTLDELRCPITEHASKAGMMMRSRSLAAGGMSLFLLEGHVSGEHRYITKGGRFERPTNDAESLTRAALALLRMAYREGPIYTRAGITLHDLSDARYRQTYLFDSASAEAERSKRERLSRAIDAINAHLGHEAIRPANTAAIDQKWRCRGQKRAAHTI